MHRKLHTCTLHLYTSPLYDRTTSSSASSEGTPTRCPRHARLTSPSSTTGESVWCGGWVVGGFEMHGWAVGGWTDSTAASTGNVWLRFVSQLDKSTYIDAYSHSSLPISSPSPSPLPLSLPYLSSFSPPPLWLTLPLPLWAPGRSSVWTPSGHD